MKRISILLAVLISGSAVEKARAVCGSCGARQSMDTKVLGPSLYVSMGRDVHGASVGHLTFSSYLPNFNLYTPAALEFTAPTRPDVVVITNSDGSLRQVNAPQALADIPVPSTTNGYVINFYYASQVGSEVAGIYGLTGSPFMSWIITNTSPGSTNEIQISKTNAAYGLIQQTLYTYAPANQGWTIQPIGGLIQQNQSVGTNTALANSFSVTNTIQSPSGPVVRQIIKTYQTLNWSASTNVAPVQIINGTEANAEVTTYTYWDPADFGAGSLVLPQEVIHPDGSWEYYTSYTTNGLPEDVYSSFEDVPVASYTSGRETVYTYTSGAVSGSGDDSTLFALTPRKVQQFVVGTPVSVSYSIFPSAGVKIDVQGASSDAAWNDAGNLYTTNLFYTSGTNQYWLQAVIRPDGTMTAYQYYPGTYLTNVVCTGMPDPTYSYVVDGTSNVTILNASGHQSSVTIYDIRSGIVMLQDTYGDFDGYGRPQQVTHLDGTTEYTSYACCGLDLTTDRDGVSHQYLYDAAKRRIGYEEIRGGTAITYSNVLDAAGNILGRIRIGMDGSQVVMESDGYDLAGERIAMTNALNGGTTLVRSYDPSNNGSLIETATDPYGNATTTTHYVDAAVKQVSGTGAHGVRYAYGVDYVGGDYSQYTEVIKLNTDGSDSSEWTKAYSDCLGRPDETLYSDSAYSQSLYNAQGQLLKAIDPDGVVTAYAYNGKGDMVYTTNDPTGADHITMITNDVVYDLGSGANVLRTRTLAWLTTGSDISTLMATSEASTDGLKSWQTKYRDTSTPVISARQISYGTNRTVTTTAPDGSYTIDLYSYGWLVSSARYDSSSAQIGETAYSYDAHGRRSAMSDARNGATVYTYNNADLVITVTTPAPGPFNSPQTTATSYDLLLRATSVVQPDGTSVSTAYLPTGEIGETFGSRTYPVAYSYDYAGRTKTMTNWSDFSAGTGARVTTWNYDSHRGFVTGKVYADNNGPSYTYTSAGRLASRTWARGTNTAYSYSSAGDLATVIYNDGGTYGVTNGYDRLGRKSAVLCGSTTTAFTYNLANDVTSESYSGGILNGLMVTNQYDSDLRRTSMALWNGSGAMTQTAYTYDNASRLASVSDGTDSAAYSYLANSPLIGQITFKRGGTTEMTTTKQYDFLNRLATIASTGGASSASPISFNYNYNNANERTMVREGNWTYWRYGYDALGQVTSGKRYWNDQTLVAGQQFGYEFDDIGNRLQTLAGGDQYGANLRVANYTNNALNQITSRDVPGYVDITGDALATNTVTVNSLTPYRKKEFFREQLNETNTGSAVWQGVTVASPGQTTVTGNSYVAQTPENFSYDLDGNLLSDGRWNYTWDGENRLVGMTSFSGAPSGSKLQLAFGYDYMGRRIQKLVSTNNGSSYVGKYTNVFAYDGWNLLGELSPAGSLIQSYLWGTDLSGSMQGAGGVGGLLQMTYYGLSTTNCFVGYDGNGNVMALVNVADGTTVADYEYGTFGEVIRATGPMAKVNPFLFQTTFYDWETDFYCYIHRYYNPSTGRFLSRDPIQERGGLDLYAFVGNDPIDRVDRCGLMSYEEMQAQIQQQRNHLYGPCCCKDPHGNDHDFTESFSAAGNTATVNLTLKFGSCASLVQIYWWDCYSAEQEWQKRGEPGGAGNWTDFGWTAGTTSYPKQATPGTGTDQPGQDPLDDKHLMTQGIVFYQMCDNGVPRIRMMPTPQKQFTWDYTQKQWTPP